MKRKDLIKKLTDNGWWLKREGSSHSWYTDGKENEALPRHSEIDEDLAKSIIKRRKLIR